MNENVVDDALKQVYRPFERGQARGRQELLGAISELHGTPQGTTSRNQRRLVAPVALSLAAVLLVGVTLAVTLWPPDAPRVSAVEEARRQLLEVRSLHLKGWQFQMVEKDGKLQVERYPTESYYERPCRYWHTYYGFSFEGNHRLQKVTRGYTASDGQRSILVSHDERSATIQPANRLATVLRTETSLQSQIFDRLMIGIPEEYRYVGTEQIQGTTCDVYEYKQASKDSFGSRQQLWLDSDSGVPVRMKVWSTFKSEPEEPMVEYHTIRINGPRPAGMFSFEAPEGFRTHVLEGEAESITLPVGATAGGGGQQLGAWRAFSIDDRAVLFAWWVDPPHDQAGLPTIPEFLIGKPGQERPCQHIPLRRDERWNWSLFLPEDDAQVGLDDRLVVRLKNPRARLSTESRPLRLPKDQLERILLEAQKSTIAADSDVEPFTLAEIREMLNLLDDGGQTRR